MGMFFEYECMGMGYAIWIIRGMDLLVVLREDGEGGVDLKWEEEGYEVSLDKS